MAVVSSLRGTHGDSKSERESVSVCVCVSDSGS